MTLSDSLSIVVAVVVAVLGIIGIRENLPARLTSRSRILRKLSRQSAQFGQFYTKVTNQGSLPRIGVAGWLETGVAVVSLASFVAALWFVPTHFEWVAPAPVLMVLIAVAAQHELDPTTRASEGEHPARMLPPSMYPLRPGVERSRVYREFVGVARYTQYGAFVLLLLSAIYASQSTDPLDGIRGVELTTVIASVAFLLYSRVLEFLVASEMEDELYKADTRLSRGTLQVEVHSKPPTPDKPSGTGSIIGIGSNLRIRRIDQAIVDFGWPDIARLVVLSDDTSVQRTKTSVPS